MTLSFISGNGSSKTLLIFQEVTFRDQNNEKTPLLKSLLYFRKWNVLASRLKTFLYFRRKL